MGDTTQRNIKEWLLAPEARTESLTPPCGLPRRREAPDPGNEDAADIDRRYAEAYGRRPQRADEVAEWEGVQAWRE